MQNEMKVAALHCHAFHALARRSRSHGEYLTTKSLQAIKFSRKFEGSSHLRVIQEANDGIPESI